jgi:predicted nucleotidyltransferase component of viral defense system
MLFTSAVEPETLALLRELMTFDFLKETRLVGGTSLALQLGHRKSIDLDFFGNLPSDRFDREELFPTEWSIERIRNTQNIKVFLINGIKVDMVNYQYPWLGEEILVEGIRLNTIKDIGAMKLSAITGRGTKKDFIDLSVLLEKFSLKELMNSYLTKYRDGSEFLVLKSLGYFNDAEEDEMPEMIIEKSWEQVKSEIKSALRNYVSNS